MSSVNMLIIHGNIYYNVICQIFLLYLLIYLIMHIDTEERSPGSYSSKILYIFNGLRLSLNTILFLLLKCLFFNKQVSLTYRRHSLEDMPLLQKANLYIYIYIYIYIFNTFSNKTLTLVHVTWGVIILNFYFSYNLVTIFPTLNSLILL